MDAHEAQGGLNGRRGVMAAGVALASLLAFAIGLSDGVVGEASAQASQPADLGSPVGLWKTIDDETGKPKAIVRIDDEGGRLTGRITRLIDPSRPNPTCDACSDDRKGKPIEGMAFLTGLGRNADGSAWEGGEILDPNNGKVYRARAKLVDDGRKLEVRGYIGAPLFGRTQTWIRD